MQATMADIAIVGGGIVGLATATALLSSEPSLAITVLEKEVNCGQHQSGHNSGVIHSGIYYKPGSLKARLCVAGAKKMIDFCTEQQVPFAICGKVIVATAEEEIPRLQELQRRGSANGLAGLRWLQTEELRALEPHTAGIAALHVPTTGIVDYRQVVRVLADRLAAKGVTFLHQAEVGQIRRSPHGLSLRSAAGDVQARLMINCAGLYADEVARRAGAHPELQIVPFRGEYYFVRPERRDLVRGLIYPVPDPRFPFLGVHFTRTVHGELEAGPNAVMAFAREGYEKTALHPGELLQTLGYVGFRRMALRYWRTGAYEYYRSFSRKAFVAALQRLVPAITVRDVIPGGSGVRAQAVAPDGRLVDDFHIQRDDRAIHVLNAPSPAATASLAIGEYIAAIALSALGETV